MSAAPPCTTCAGPTRVVTGAGGTWIRCTTGTQDNPGGRTGTHDTAVTSRALRRTTRAFVAALAPLVVHRGDPVTEAAARDTRSTYHDLIRHHRHQANTAHGLTTEETAR